MELRAVLMRRGRRGIYSGAIDRQPASLYSLPISTFKEANTDSISLRFRTADDPQVPLLQRDIVEHPILNPLIFTHTDSMISPS